MGRLMPKKYKTIVADPPWQYGKWGSGSSKSRYSGENFNTGISMPYQTMTVAEIADIPVCEMADEDCDLYLWTTQKYLPHAFDVMKAWGFRYCQTLTWCKAPMGLGQGGLFCPTTEFILIGRKGHMPKGKRRIDTTWWNWPRAWKTHSRKPEAAQDIIEMVSDGPRVELFARRERPGWDVWGNEVECTAELTSAA